MLYFAIHTLTALTILYSRYQYFSHIGQLNCACRIAKVCIIKVHWTV